MTIPLDDARQLATSFQSSRILNLIAQSKAKQVLREVHEPESNYPSFTANLDERITYVAYGLLAAGCSLLDHEQTADGYANLQSAAELLESAHRTEASESRNSSFHCLIGAMAYYACGQYSRAFVLIRNIESHTLAANVIASFLRKNATQLIERLNAVFISRGNPEAEIDIDSLAINITVARAVSLAFEYAFSGDSTALDSARETLKDAMLIAETNNNPANWWLARLLMLMLDDYNNNAMWNTLPPYFGPDGFSTIDKYIRLHACSDKFAIELWQSQRACLDVALNLNNSGGVINLRTSAGKTRVAELTILQTLGSNPNSKILYLAPFRSLAFELERKFSSTMVPLGFSVSHLYGGARFSSVDRVIAKDASIIIATPEKARAMLRAAPETFESVACVIVDEGHLLGGSERDVKNELFIEHIRTLCRKNGARMLLMSAVLPNAEELALWIGSTPSALAKSDWKPSDERFGLLRWSKTGVEIEWIGEEKCFNPHFVDFSMVLTPGGRKLRRFPNKKQEAVAAAATKLTNLGPVLIFAGQAKWVASMTINVLLAMGPGAPDHDWPVNEWKSFKNICIEELGADSLEMKAVKKGVIPHSGKLPSQVRIAIEHLMSKHPPKIIVATTTLGQGVNIGISTVIFATTYISANQISHRDFWNICGRAGRAFVDGEGKILFAIDTTRKRWNAQQEEDSARFYLDRSHAKPIESGLLQVIRVLQNIAEAVNLELEVFLEILANSDFVKLGKFQAGAESLLDMIDDHLLALHLDQSSADITQDPATWIDDVFRGSLAAIQLHARSEDELNLTQFIAARTVGVLRRVSSSERARAVIASSLPFSVGLKMNDALDDFRIKVDDFLANAEGSDALNVLVGAFEKWACANASTICEHAPDQDLLDRVRPLWLSGESLSRIDTLTGSSFTNICRQFYEFELPWVIHAAAQQLNKETEEERIETLARVSLLVELGLPNQMAANVFMAGIRSRVSAIELARYIPAEFDSASLVQVALNGDFFPDLPSQVSEATSTWLHLIADDRRRMAGTEFAPTFSNFKLKNVPVQYTVLHPRKSPDDKFFVCSADGRFVTRVRELPEIPFSLVANDPKYAFTRDGEVWSLVSRDPRILP